MVSRIWILSIGGVIVILICNRSCLFESENSRRASAEVLQWTILVSRSNFFAITVKKYWKVLNVVRHRVTINKYQTRGISDRFDGLKRYKNLSTACTQGTAFYQSWTGGSRLFCVYASNEFPSSNGEKERIQFTESGERACPHFTVLDGIRSLAPLYAQNVYFELCWPRLLPAGNTSTVYDFVPYSIVFCSILFRAMATEYNRVTMHCTNNK